LVCSFAFPFTACGCTRSFVCVLTLPRLLVTAAWFFHRAPCAAFTLPAVRWIRDYHHGCCYAVFAVTTYLLDYWLPLPRYLFLVRLLLDVTYVKHWLRFYWATHCLHSSRSIVAVRSHALPVYVPHRRLHTVTTTHAAFWCPHRLTCTPLHTTHAFCLVSDAAILVCCMRSDYCG